jgi:membrane-associated phospholipid phosphatase
VSPWYGFAGYTVATATGTLRMLKNAHWFSDVVAGAGIGILTTRFTYFAYPLLKKGIQNNTHVNMMITPTVYQGKPGIHVLCPL